MNSLEVKNLSFAYGTQVVFRDIAFSLKSGELCALLGINGSGKSTLLRCCTGLLSPKSGEIFVSGKNIVKSDAPAIAKTAAFVPQDHPVSFPYSVYEMVLMGRTTHISNFFQIADIHHVKTEAAIKRLNLEHLSNKSFTELSGGQRQLVLIARALAQETPLLLLDEPTASLDFKNQLLIWNTMRQLQEEGKAILVCTHDPNHVLWYCNRVVVMAEQHIIADGEPEQVLTTDILTRIYGPICHLSSDGNTRMVMPKKNN